MPFQRIDAEKLSQSVVRQIEQLIASGMGVCDSCREVGVSEKTF